MNLTIPICYNYTMTKIHRACLWTNKIDNVLLHYILLYICFVLYLIFAMLYFLLVGISAMILKVFATMYCLFREPIASLSSMPTNWSRISLCTDVLFPPELMPGISNYEQITGIEENEKIGPGLGRFCVGQAYSNFLLGLNKDKSISDYIGSLIVLLFVFIPELLFLYFPALVYRFSLKSTSLVYLPFIWMVRHKDMGERDLRVAVREFVEHPYEKLKRRYAYFVVGVLFVLPAIVFVQMQKFKTYFVGKEMFVYFFPLESIGSWHITRLGSSVITILLYWYFSSVQMAINEGVFSDQNKALFILNYGTRLRAILSLFTIVCGLYIVYTTSSIDWSTLPAVEWFPWLED